MDKITVLSENSSIFNLQKLVLSDQLYPSSVNGKFVYYSTAEAKCVCQLFLSKLLQPSFCNIDCSVVYLDPRCYPSTSELLNNNVQSLTPSSITEVLSTIESIKTLSIHIVFDTPLSANKWKHDNTKLRDIVKHLLQLYVLLRGAVVSLRAVTNLFKINIELIYIDGMDINIGRVVSSTKVKIERIMSKVTFEQTFVKTNLPTFAGLEIHLQQLKSIMEKVKVSEGSPNTRNYKQMLIIGPPGCGKTTLVCRAAKEFQMVVKTIQGPELVNPLPGEAEQQLTDAFDECKLLAQECSAGCVMVLKHVESVCGRRKGSAEGHVARLANRLCALLETVNSTPGLMVVGTSSCPLDVDPAVRRPGRFDHEIHVEMSSEGERADILRVLTGFGDSVCGRVAKWTPGFVAADLALLASNVARQGDTLGLFHKLDGVDEEKVLSVCLSCVGQLQPSALRGQLGVIAQTPSVGLTSGLSGVDHVLLRLRQAVQWPLTLAHEFTKMGLPHPKGVLLYGPPGCAKTSLARAIAMETHTTFLAVSAAQIYSPYVGDSERIIAELFHRARIGAPSILFIDEIDALVGCRGHREKGSQERILTSFLTEMDGIGTRLDAGASQGSVVVIAATNRPQTLDPALTRPGRFDKLIYVGPPDSSQRLGILQKLTEKMPMADDVDLSWVAENSQLFSGADLTKLCKEAGLCALTQDGMAVPHVSHRHWTSALAAMQPSLTSDQQIVSFGDS